MYAGAKNETKIHDSSHSLQMGEENLAIKKPAFQRVFTFFRYIKMTNNDSGCSHHDLRRQNCCEDALHGLWLQKQKFLYLKNQHHSVLR